MPIGFSDSTTTNDDDGRATDEHTVMIAILRRILQRWGAPDEDTATTDATTTAEKPTGILHGGETGRDTAL
jgi:hypothetical protein